MPNIADFLASIPGLKADYKTDWTETSEADWRIDWDAQADAVAVNTVAPVITGTFIVGQAMTVSNGTWTGNPAPTYSYQFYSRDTNSVVDFPTGWEAIGDGSNQVTPGGGMVGDYVVAVVTADNNVGAVVTAMSAVVGPVTAS